MRTSDDEIASRADVLCGIAMVDRGQCRYAAAIKNFDAALPCYEFLRDREGRAFALYGRGGAHRFLGRYREARADLSKALKLAPDRSAETFTRMALGGLLRMMGRYAESLAQYRAARVLAGRARDQYAMAYADCGIGNAHRMLGHRAEARKHLALADARYREIGDIVSRPYTLFAISLMDFEEGKSGRLDAAEALFRQTGDERGLAHVHLARAVASLALGRSAVRHLRAAENISTALGLRLEAAHAHFLRLFGRADAAKRYRALHVRAPRAIFALP